MFSKQIQLILISAFIWTLILPHQSFTMSIDKSDDHHKEISHMEELSPVMVNFLDLLKTKLIRGEKEPTVNNLRMIQLLLHVISQRISEIKTEIQEQSDY